MTFPTPYNYERKHVNRFSYYRCDNVNNLTNSSFNEVNTCLTDRSLS